MKKLLKNGLLAVSAIAVSAISGMQLLGLEKHVPDGPRILVMLGYMGIASLACALVGLLFIIPKANRNGASFLKAFVVAGALACLGNCSSWMSKFQGPKKWIASESGISFEVPADWETPAEKVPSVELILTDWASTSFVNAMRVPSDDPAPNDAAFEQMLAILEEQGQSRLGLRVDSFPCGPGCRGGQYDMTTRGKQTRFVLLVRHTGTDWLVLTGATFATPVEQRIAVVADILRSVRINPAKPDSP